MLFLKREYCFYQQFLKLKCQELDDGVCCCSADFISWFQKIRNLFMFQKTACDPSVQVRFFHINMEIYRVVTYVRKTNDDYILCCYLESTLFFFFVSHENIVIHVYMHNELILLNTMQNKGIHFSLCSISPLFWFGFQTPLIQFPFVIWSVYMQFSL